MLDWFVYCSSDVLVVILFSECSGSYLKNCVKIMYLKRMDFGVNDVSSVFSSFCSSGVLVVTLFAE